MRRDLYMAMGGLPEFFIVGSGDHYSAFSFLHRVEHVFDAGLSPGFRSCMKNKAEFMWETLNTAIRDRGMAGMMSYLPLNLTHAWHGTQKNRHYSSRWKIVFDNGFNPSTDMVGFQGANCGPGEMERMRTINDFVRRKVTVPSEHCCDPTIAASRPDPTPSDTDQLLRVQRLQTGLLSYFLGRKENEKSYQSLHDAIQND
jgi:hypothetical protein